jgi:hypothetical protein
LVTMHLFISINKRMYCECLAENSKREEYSSSFNIQNLNSKTKYVGGQMCFFHTDLATHQHSYSRLWMNISYHFRFNWKL